MMVWTKVKVAAVVVATGLLAGGVIAGAVAAGANGQTARNAPETVGGQTDKARAADAAKQTGEGQDCMRRMSYIGGALIMYGNQHDWRLPPDLGSALTHLPTKGGIPLTPKEKAERFLSPKDAKEVQIPEQPTPEWVNQHTSFIYLGSSDIVYSGISESDAAKTIILYEKRKAGYPNINGGIPSLFVDGSVQACHPDEVELMIAESRKILEAARVPATGPAK